MDDVGGGRYRIYVWGKQPQPQFSFPSVASQFWVGCMILDLVLVHQQIDTGSYPCVGFCFLRFLCIVFKYLEQGEGTHDLLAFLN